MAIPRSMEALLSARRGETKPWLILPEAPHRSDAHRSVSYAEMAAAARRIAGGLRQLGAAQGDRVVVIADNSVEAALLLLGALAAGMVAVPVAPCTLGQERQRWATTVKRVATHCAARLLVGRAEVLPRDSDGIEHEVQAFDSVSAGGSEAPLPCVSEGDLAVIQYTSGTTASPRGVELTLGNVIANIEGIGRAIDVADDKVGLTWLPLFHDMGLIGSLLFGTYHGLSIVFMTPRAFLTRPEAWLWAIARFRVNCCAAPNAAYQTCAVKVPDRKLEGLDLSSWRVALNGSEQVHPETIAAFSQRFARYGFRPRAMLPVYGLAENTLATAIPRLGSAPAIDWVDREKLERGGVAQTLAAGEQRAARGVACVGRALLGQELRVVDPDLGTAVGERRVGSVEVRGPCTMRGYRGDSERTAAVLRADGWLRTGDRGYLAGSELYVVGRDKQVIKRAGRSLDADEIQRVVRGVAGVRGGLVAVFGVPDAREGTEALVVAAETDARPVADLASIEGAIVEALARELSIRPEVVVLAELGVIPRTTSGKVQHTLAREQYLAGGFDRAKRAREVEAAQGYLVLGTGRCGSTLLSNMLRLHPEILSLSELFTVLGGPRAFLQPELDGARFEALLCSTDPDVAAIVERAAVPEILLRPRAAEPADAASGLRLVTLPHLTDQHEELLGELRTAAAGFPLGAAGAQFERLFCWLRNRLGRRIWIERSGGSIEYADQLCAQFPDTALVYVLRDGPACARSMARHPFFRVRVARLVAGDPTLDVEQCLGREVTVDRYGAYWSALMAKTERLIRGAGARRTFVLRYERLTAAPEETLAQLGKFLQLQGSLDAWIAEARALVRPARTAPDELADGERAALERACRPGMRILERIAP